MNDELLSMAACEGREGEVLGDGGPFGAIITDMDGNIVCREHNRVLSNNDPTAHAEVMAIRKACDILNTYDLSNYILYSSCEPCPMCLSAIIWSNIKKVYYGADRYNAEDAGFRDSMIYDYLNKKNNILEKEYKKNAICIDILEKYKGEVY